MPSESHLTENQIRAYAEKKLGAADLLAVDDHLAGCAECRSRVGDMSSLAGSVAAVRSFVSGGAAAGIAEHPGYERLSAYVDGTDSTQDRAETEGHLETCGECRIEADDLALLRVQMESRVKPAPRRLLFGVLLRPAMVLVPAAVAAVFVYYAGVMPVQRQLAGDTAAIDTLRRQVHASASALAPPPRPSRQTSLAPKVIIRYVPVPVAAKPTAAVPAAPAAATPIVQGDGVSLTLTSSGEILRTEKVALIPPSPPAPEVHQAKGASSQPNAPVAAQPLDALGSPAPVPPAAVPENAAPAAPAQPRAQMRAFSPMMPAPRAAPMMAPILRPPVPAPSHAETIPHPESSDQGLLACARIRYAGDPLALGMALANAGDYADATAEVQKYIALHPHDRAAARLLARLRLVARASRP